MTHNPTHSHTHAAEHGHQHDGSSLADLLDLDDAVFGSYLDTATAWLAEFATMAPRRIADIGAGTTSTSAGLMSMRSTSPGPHRRCTRSATPTGYFGRCSTR